MTVPWRVVEPLDPETFAHVRRRAIFDCCKWDPQVEDTSSIANAPLVLTRQAWNEVTALAESLAREALEAEEEIASRPDLHGRLTLPGPLGRVLARTLGHGRMPRTPAIARLIRFDFHHTTDGWRISEANTDVPGGMNEASGLSALVASHYTGTSSAGDVAGEYVRTIVAENSGAPHIALVHATAYTDDRQVMSYIARRFDELGARTSLVSPADLKWQNGQARLATEWSNDAVDAIVRFFPVEWLPNLPFGCGWKHLFHEGTTPVSNPGTALLTQTKRFPLVWDSLRTALPTWHALLPETRDPRDVPWHTSDEWMLKPALGRVGDGIGILGITEQREWMRIIRAVQRHPEHWIAQRRFSATSMVLGDEQLYPCVGVYTVDTRAVGAYGRIARRPIIDWRARDAAVLIADDDVRRAQNDPHVERNRYQRTGS
jgi:glutathionylspermidine synthase